MAGEAHDRVVVIGGGIVGVCCALALQREGRRVVIVERDEPGMGTAIASCGFIAVSEVVPLSKPDILRRAPGWLLDPKGPLTIRPRALPGLIPWFLRFMWNARPRRIEEITGQLAALTLGARQDYDDLLRPLGLAGLIRSKPVILLYDHADELAAERASHDRRRRLGFDVEELSGAEAAELEPAIAKDFAKAVVFKDWRAVVDTYRFVTALTDAFVSAGGTFHRGAVSGFRREGDRITGVELADGPPLPGREIVVAAGAWSKALAARLGIKLMIQAVAGYQTVLADPGLSLDHGIAYAAGGFGITPMESGLAIAGTIEFSGLGQAPDYRRARIIVGKAKRVLPGLKAEGGLERVGWRPLCPDTLPVIDRAPGVANLYFATGHGQLGVTLGATTGRLIAGLITGRRPNLNLAPYGATRF
jgi:D-amino-acid dehydrogenase